MRVTNPPDVQGYWWLPKKEKNKLPGRLIVSESGNVYLHLLGVFDGGMHRNDRKIPIIHGITAEGKLATLVDCYYKNRQFRASGIDSAEVHAMLLLIGSHFNSENDLLFSKVGFHIEGLDEWLSISGISIEHNFEAHAATITYSPPNPINYSIENDINFSIQFGWTIPLVADETEAKITQRASLSLEYSNPTGLSDIRNAVYKINNLLCLALNTPVALTSFSVSHPNITRKISDKEIPIEIHVYYPSLPHPDNPPKVSWGRMLFTYKEISEGFAPILSNWLYKYTLLEPAFIFIFLRLIKGTGILRQGFYLLFRDSRPFIGGQMIRQ